jgi:hypothetical protein
MAAFRPDLSRSAVLLLIDKKTSDPTPFQLPLLVALTRLKQQQLDPMRARSTWLLDLCGRSAPNDFYVWKIPRRVGFMLQLGKTLF